MLVQSLHWVLPACQRMIHTSAQTSHTISASHAELLTDVSHRAAQTKQPFTVPPEAKQPAGCHHAITTDTREIWKPAALCTRSCS